MEKLVICLVLWSVQPSQSADKTALFSVGGSSEGARAASEAEIAGFPPSALQFDEARKKARPEPVSGEINAVVVYAATGEVRTDADSKAAVSIGLVDGSVVRVVSGSWTEEMVFLNSPPQKLSAPLAYINSDGVFSLVLSTASLRAGDSLQISASSASLVDVSALSQGMVRLDIRYATADNFTGKKVYDSAKCYLRKPAAAALMKAALAAAASEKPFSLCVFDCYRPLSVQKKFWAIMPDERYVADPAKGSRHNRGLAVDLTACGSDGKEFLMPTGYDDFTSKAARDYDGAPAGALENRRALQEIMTSAGFIPLPTEWWHFDYPGQAEILDVPIK